MTGIARTGDRGDRGGKSVHRGRLARRLAAEWQAAEVAEFLCLVLDDPNAAQRWLIAQIPRLDPAYVNTGTNVSAKKGTVNTYAIERDFGYWRNTVVRAVKENQTGGTGIDHTPEEAP